MTVMRSVRSLLLSPSLSLLLSLSLSLSLSSLAYRQDLPDEVISLPFEGNGYQFQAIEVAQCVLRGDKESSIMPLV
jgi:hypothetical protein